jgi:glycosyltransferase involved in cell wall biosynthesis
MGKDTIAFVSTYAHPSRDSIEKTLREVFPEFKLEVIDLSQVLKAHRRWKIPNVLATLREYGNELMKRRATLRERYFLTTFLLRRIRSAMPRFIDRQRHVFSFQTQSLYDTAVPGVPHFIYTDHTHLSNLHSTYFDPKSLRPPAWRALEREIYHHAACVFTRSTDVTRDLVQQYGLPASKTACVYAGSNVRVAPGFEPQNDNYSNRHVIFVGGDWVRKGGPELARAFERVLEVYPDAHLTIVGAQPDLHLPHCTVLGQVPLDQLTQHYAKASVFCLPTKLEPFGIAFLEAMMHRLPIVATRIGAVPDMVQPGVTGELVNPGDADGLATALIALLGDPVRCQLYGAAGFERATQVYTWNRVGERMRERILPLIGRPSVVARRG